MTSRTMIRGFETSAISRSANAHASACGDLMVVRGAGTGAERGAPRPGANARGAAPAAAGRGRAALAGVARAPRGARARGSGRRPHCPCNQRGRVALGEVVQGRRGPWRRPGAGQCGAGRAGCRQRGSAPLAPAAAFTDAAVPAGGGYRGGGALGAHAAAVACRQAVDTPQIRLYNALVWRVQWRGTGAKMPTAGAGGKAQPSPLRMRNPCIGRPQVRPQSRPTRPPCCRCPLRYTAQGTPRRHRSSRILSSPGG